MGNVCYFFLLVNLAFSNAAATLNNGKMDSLLLSPMITKAHKKWISVIIDHLNNDNSGDVYLLSGRDDNVQATYRVVSNYQKNERDELNASQSSVENSGESFKLDRHTWALIGIFILGGVAITWLNYCLKKSNRIQQLENRLTREKILSCERELIRFTHKVVEKANRIELLNKELEKVRKKVGQEASPPINHLDRLMHSTILTDKEWKEFKVLFETVYPGFFCNLRARYADLSTSEIRLAGLIKLNLTSKEISNMLGISHESVNKSRYRLRKKLNLSKEENLKEHFEGL
ncbi:hypothetical protein QQ020_34565 [Fulvivirgaceae bacterium BMA12]|uniref:HTH luxR-type domain-containing protein n=1 Tax=Agaribacillus aureus TaxID=3051825 RepID=A0ABT8LLP7_9BACT|nr:hypothetical protein [Fulvivirgaceae bacterium BMA12]